MKKILVIILLIAVICVSSGAFAIISNYGLENTNDDAKNSLVNDIKDMSSESFLNNIKNDNIMDDFKDYWQYKYGYLVNVDGELRHYINDNGAYYLESEGILDRYIRCVECGGFIPIGEITNPLPKAAICHHDGISGLNFSEVIKYSYTRDKAYNLWFYDGMPVCDDIHSEIDVNKVPPIVCNDYTRCNECHGFVPLNANGYLPDNALCHHYNGSLNVDEIPKDNLYDKYDAYFIFQNEEYASNQIISCDYLNYDDYHNYGKYIAFHEGFSYRAITYYDIVNYLEHHIKPESNLSFVVENNNFNSSEEILDNSSNVYDIGNNNSIIPYDEPPLPSEENASYTKF